MATNKSVTKVTDKVTKVSEQFTVYMYDNGFMFEVNGRDKKGDYTCAKILCNSVEDVIKLVHEVTSLERDS